MTSRESERVASSEPNSGEIKAALARVLAASSFVQAGRATEFLRFVVEETLAGRGDRLKGYTVGVEVFGRTEDFDPQTDPLVRVEAGRLRQRLGGYYGGEGQHDPVRIELPQGAYRPRFSYASSVSGSPKDAAHGPQPRRRADRAVGAGVVGLAALAALAVWWGPWRSEPAEDYAAALALPSGPRILVVPFANLTGRADLAFFARGMSEELTLRLSRSDVFVITSHTDFGGAGAPLDLARLRAELGIGYVLTGSVRREGDEWRVSARLAEAEAGTQLWAASYEEQSSVEALLALQDEIAERVATTLGTPLGPIFDHETARADSLPAPSLGSYECVLRYYHYVHVLNAEAHKDAVDCLERSVATEPEFAQAWACLALLYIAEYRSGFNARPERDDALARAREAARHALDIDGGNWLSHVAMAGVRFVDGDFQGFERSGARALELAPNYPEALAMMGTYLAISGHWERGLPLLDKAVALSYQPPGWFKIAPALWQLRNGDNEQALESALELDMPDWHLAAMTVAASAALAGRTELAERAASRLLEQQPDFPQRVRDELAKWHFEPLLLERMLEGLRLAGIEAE